MWEDMVFSNINLDFFANIEDNGAFCFSFDDNHKIIPNKDTKYHLFESDIYPFIIYHDKLRSLNQYCYETAQTIRRYISEAINTYKTYIATAESEFYTEPFTKHEILIGCQEEMYLCERIVWYSSSHIVTLLYSFLERTLKKLWTDIFLEKIQTSILSKSNVKLYVYIEKIFGVPVSEFSQKYAEIYRKLEIVRKYRNQVNYGKFRIGEFNDEYEEVNELPPFQLIELIELISNILDLVELKYLTLADMK